MVSFTMVPSILPQQQLQQQQQQQQVSPCCPCQTNTTSSDRLPCLSLRTTTDAAQSLLLPVRLTSTSATSSLSIPSHAYNLRSSSRPPNRLSTPHALPLADLPPTPPTLDDSLSSITSGNSPLYSFPALAGPVDVCDDDDLFTYEDTTLKQDISNALGVDFSQYSYSNNNNNTSFNQWSGSYSAIPHPIERLLNSDINTKNNASQSFIPEQPVFAASTDGNPSTTHTFDNTVFQQLQGFRLSNQHLNRTKKQENMSSSPQTPRDGAALFSSFGGIGVNAKSTADFDFDMLAASFLNDQVAAFDSASHAKQVHTAASTTADNFFANLPIIGSPLNFNTNATSTSPPLQNAFRTFSNANDMVNGTPQHPQQVIRNNSLSSSSTGSPALASPAFDASTFPFNFAAAAANNGTAYNSPNFSGVDTPALVPDDGNDLAASLTTSPMWGQLDLGSISLFPQQQQQPQIVSPAIQQQQAPLPTISPKELSLPLLDQNINTVQRQAKPASALSKSNQKRVRESPAFGDDDGSNEEEEEEEVQVSKKTRRAASNATSASTRASSVLPVGSFNGTRHTSSAPLPLDAPTQARTYHGPESKTSKRAVPAAAARKVAAIKAQAEMIKQHARRSVSVAAADNDDGNADEDSLDGEVKEAIEMSIEAKRRQNTIAARRSRQRKAEHLAGLEESIRLLTERVNSLENEKMVWMMRAMAAGWTEDTRSA